MPEKKLGDAGSERRRIIAEKEERLIVLLQPMDAPVRRIIMRDWRWFGRNLEIRNSEHENFREANKLIRELVRLGT